MKYKQLISGAFLLWTCIACSGKKEQAATVCLLYTSDAADE